MKKALAMALGAVLVAGSAAPASAASQVDFSGFYGARYAVNGNLGYTGEDNLNESFFESRFQVDVTFQATDEVSVYWRLRGPKGERWGTNRNDDGGGVGGQAREITTRYVYGQVVQDWGTVRVGRLTGGLGDAFGLQDLGWTPQLDKNTSSIGPFDGLGEYDSIQYQNKWDNGFGLTATYSKIAAQGEGGWEVSDGSDHDTDRFQIQPTYQWDTGGVALNMYYQRAATSPDISNPPAGDNANNVLSVWYINPAFAQSWGAFSVHFEGMLAFGEQTVTDTNDNRDKGQDDYDAEGQAFYLDFNYNYGPGRVNLAGWWVSGNDVDNDYPGTQARGGNGRENNALADLSGTSFYPLVVAYVPGGSNDRGYWEGPSHDGRRNTDNTGAVGVANQAYSSFDLDAIISDNGGIVAGFDSIIGDTVFSGDYINSFARANNQANHWALMISGQHAFTDEITFNYALAYLALTNPNYEVMERAVYDSGTTSQSYSYATQDKDMGWEIDLGVNIQLLDNLQFSSTAGYMFTGDAYKNLKGYKATDLGGGDYSVEAQWEDADDAYSWVNTLIFSF